MTISFTKVNATNNAAAREQMAEEKRDSKVKAAEKKAGKGPKNKADKVKGTNDGKEAKKEAEIV